MSGISARPDLPTVKALLTEAQLPTDDLTAVHCEHFFYAGKAEYPDGIIGIETFGGVGLLRSLVVRVGSRGAGLGAELVRRIEEYARSRGVQEIYLLTTTAKQFFESRGYRIASRDAAPDSIRSTREFAGICPASAAFMFKRLE